nr:PREDICTED: uncharacterized protein LOC109032542 [Bemisia tabaci]
MYLKSCIFVASSLMLLHVVSAVTLKDLQDRLPSACTGASPESHQRCQKLYKDYKELAKTDQYKRVADKKCGRLDNVQCYRPEASTANTPQSRIYTCAGNPLKGGVLKETNLEEKIPIKQCIDKLAGTGGSGSADPGNAGKPK